MRIVVNAPVLMVLVASVTSIDVFVVVGLDVLVSVIMTDLAMIAAVVLLVSSVTSLDCFDYYARSGVCHCSCF